MQQDSNNKAAATDGERTADIEGDSLGAYRAALRAFVARRIGDPHEAEDLVQEACARLIATARQRSLNEPQAYLFRIAANLIADRGRRGPAVLPLTEELHPSIAPRQEERRRVVDLQQALDAALAELSPRARTIFVMRRFDEMSTGDIARSLGISPRMVQKHLTHAVSHLYDRLAYLREVAP
ncbi:RNA polymerase sigma factor [Sphingomonas sanguinis]|uniref:RNA polymerase sigma factor n=1 Tax=Sphingomonas sp. LC-1 TaxID=3110957 RepID=UPI0021BBA216|nr:RNA polymerase sigma factor [Sphingomonas sp. LC-1]MCT8002248.1 RNA polymerase sigma factor [Sphingomonas sp. LC-1]